jgi:hypothetical protein
MKCKRRKVCVLYGIIEMMVQYKVGTAECCCCVYKYDRVLIILCVVR